jgi:hypothetical protein
MRWLVILLTLAVASPAFASPKLLFLAAMKQTASAPSAPGSFAVSNSPAQITATWADLTDETSYEVFYSTSSALTATTSDGSTAYLGSPNATAGRITGIAAGSVGYTLNGMLTAGVTYYVRVAGRNAAGLGTLTATASAVAAAYVFTGTGFEDGNIGTFAPGTPIAGDNMVAGIVEFSTDTAQTGARSLKLRYASSTYFDEELQMDAPNSDIMSYWLTPTFTTGASGAQVTFQAKAATGTLIYLNYTGGPGTTRALSGNWQQFTFNLPANQTLSVEFASVGNEYGAAIVYVDAVAVAPL